MTSSSVLGRPIVGDQLTFIGEFVTLLSKSQFIFTFYIVSGLPCWLSGKQSAWNAGDIRDMGSIPGSEDPLEEDVATHFSILPWEIPKTEEPGGLPCRGSQRASQKGHAVTVSQSHN